MTSPDSNHADAARSAGAVLVVDDEPALLEVFEAILKRNFEVCTAGNAREADVLLREKTFKVIVADYTMPGETGLSFLARAQLAYPQTQRVLMTGNMTPDMRRSAAESELLFAFLEKPITIARLVDVVRAAARMHDTAPAAK